MGVGDVRNARVTAKGAGTTMQLLRRLARNTLHLARQGGGGDGRWGKDMQGLQVNGSTWQGATREVTRSVISSLQHRAQNVFEKRLTH